jgi:ABC-2 type transport system permease protein
MRTLLRAAADETRLIFTDAGVLIITVVAVVFYSFFYPVPYLNEVLRDVSIAVEDQDHSALSRRLIGMVDAHSSVRVAARVSSQAEGISMLTRGEVTGVLVVPRGFEQDVLRGRAARVSAEVDASYLLQYSAVTTGVVESAGTLSAGVEIARFRASGRTRDAAMRARRPVGLDLRPLFNVSSGYAAYVVPAVLVLILQQTLLIGIGMTGGARRERIGVGRGLPLDRQGHPILQVAGRALPFLLLYGLNAAYYFGFVPRYYGYTRPGSAAAVVVLTVPFLLATTLLGFTLRIAFRRRETAMQILLFTSLPLVFLGGFAWPVEALPPWLRVAAQAVPTTSAIPAYLRLMRMGAGLGDVAAQASVLWSLVAIYFPLACLVEWMLRPTARWGQTPMAGPHSIGV